MKINRYIAILVFLGSAAWVATGEFSSAGSDSGEGNGAKTEQASEKAAAPAKEETIQTVGVAVIPQSEHARSITISGVTQADKKTVMTARAGGIIGKLTVKQGDQVKKGDIVASIAPEGREAALHTAQQLLEQRKAEADATKRLVEKGTMPRLQGDNAMSALKQAESQLEAAKAEMDKLDIVAPFDGIINELSVEDGSAVQPGAPVATLISLDPIIGVGEVNESDLGVVEVGEKADLRLVTGKTVTGTVRYVSRSAQPATRTYTVEIEVANPDLAVPAGMTTEIILRGQPVLATPVPRSVVALNAKGELGVRTVNDENKVEFHPIDIVDDSTGALILGGIPKGARVIVAGQNFVGDGDTVNPVQADPETINRLIDEASGGAS